MWRTVRSSQSIQWELTGNPPAWFCLWQTVMFDDMKRVVVEPDSLLIITCQLPVSPSLLSFTFLLQSAATANPHTKYLAILKKKQVPDSLFTHQPVWLPFIAVAESDSGQMIYQMWHLGRSEITTAWYHLLWYFTPPGSSFNVWECIFMRWSQSQ